jgi:hypothetical protein
MAQQTIYILCEYSPRGNINERSVQQVEVPYPNGCAHDHSSHAIAELKRRFPRWQCPIILDLTLEQRNTWPAISLE